MIKLISNIILITLVLHSQLYNSIVTMNYEINSAYYAEELCENKDKPQMHCDGQCYFSKQLALDKDRQSDTEPPTFLPIIRLFPGNANPIVPITGLEPSVALHSLSDHSLPRDFFLSGIEHPPQV